MYLRRSGVVLQWFFFSNLALPLSFSFHKNLLSTYYVSGTCKPFTHSLSSNPYKNAVWISTTVISILYRKKPNNLLKITPLVSGWARIHTIYLCPEPEHLTTGVYSLFSFYLLHCLILFQLAKNIIHKSNDI